MGDNSATSQLDPSSEMLNTTSTATATSVPGIAACQSVSSTTSATAAPSTSTSTSQFSVHTVPIGTGRRPLPGVVGTPQNLTGAVKKKRVRPPRRKPPAQMGPPGGSAMCSTSSEVSTGMQRSVAAQPATLNCPMGAAVHTSVASAIAAGHVANAQHVQHPGNEFAPHPGQPILTGHVQPQQQQDTCASAIMAVQRNVPPAPRLSGGLVNKPPSRKPATKKKTAEQKNAALCDEVARLQQRIATTQEDIRTVIKRLIHVDRLKQRREANALKRQLAAAANASPKVEAARSLLLEAAPIYQDSVSTASVTQQVLAHLECFHAYIESYEFSAAVKCLDAALKIAGIQFEWTGALGKRTRFQTSDVAQMKIVASKNDDCCMPLIDTEHLSEWLEPTSSMPEICPLQDDTLLDGVKLSDEQDKLEEQKIYTLLGNDPIFAALLNAFVVAAVRAQCAPQDVNRHELKKAGLDVLLGSAVPNWCLRQRCLYDRCVLEQTSRRRVERALEQAAALCDNNATYDFAVDRLRADLLLSLGVVGEALDIFVALRLWQPAVDCYTSMGKLDRALHLVEENLAEATARDRPIFLCLKGDILQDEKYYEQAWQESQRSCSRAMRSAGLLFSARKLWSESLRCYELAVKLQPMHFQSQYNMAYACMQLELFDKAAQAYHRAVGLDPDHAEAWSNLAAALMQIQGEESKERAHRILKSEALRHNFENRRVWNNFLLLSAHLAEVNDAIRAYHRLLDLDNTFCDPKVVNALTNVVLQDASSDEKATAQLRSQLRELLARATAMSAGHAELWRRYADLIHADGQMDGTLAITLQRAQAAALAAKGWELNQSEISATAEYSRRLVSRQLERAADSSLSVDLRKQAAAQGRMAARTLVTRLKMCLDKNDELTDELTEHIGWLQDKVADLSSLEY